MLRYPCLVLDHDDTAVDSTVSVNYPQFCEAMKVFRPGFHMTLEEYLLYCYKPGFYEMCEQILHYTPEEMAAHLQMWKDYHADHHPAFFPGVPELIRRQKAEGGYVCVVSHSSNDVIEEAYALEGLPMPDLIFGAEQPAERRKPSAWPMEQILSRLQLAPSQLLMVDDMPHGGIMSHKVGVEFACAGWCNMLPQIEGEMRKQADYFFAAVEELSDFLFPAASPACLCSS